MQLGSPFLPSFCGEARTSINTVPANESKLFQGEIISVWTFYDQVDALRYTCHCASQPSNARTCRIHDHMTYSALSLPKFMGHMIKLFTLHTFNSWNIEFAMSESSYTYACNNNCTIMEVNEIDNTTFIHTSLMATIP